MRDDHKKLVMGWLSDRKDTVKVLQARRGDGHGLDFDEVGF